MKRARARTAVAMDAVREALAALGPIAPTVLAGAGATLAMVSGAGGLQLSGPDTRTVVNVSNQSGTFYADQNNTIYDFGGNNAPTIFITATSNTEVRNVVGAGLRHIGDRDGLVRTNIGFRDCEGTFFNVRHDGDDVFDPFFIGCVDVNPQPHVADGDIMQVFAYNADIHRPLVEGCVIYGKERPSGSTAHNDGLQFTGIGGVVYDPTVRGNTILGASSAGIQAKIVFGLFTIENNTLSERFESFHAVIAKPGVAGQATMLWRNNTMIDGASAAITDGWLTHPDTVPQAGVTIS